MQIAVFTMDDQENFPVDSHQALISHGFTMSNQSCPTIPVFDVNDLATFDGALAIGAGVGSLVVAAGKVDDDRARASWAGSSFSCKLRTLVLLAPALPSDAFLPIKSKASLSARCIDVFSRVVVLVAPQDSTAATNMCGPNPSNRPCMANAGLMEGSDARVSAIDISGLIEDRANSARGALCSYEAMGLIARLLRGVPPEAAITPFARLLV